MFYVFKFYDKVFFYFLYDGQGAVGDPVCIVLAQLNEKLRPCFYSRFLQFQYRMERFSDYFQVSSAFTQNHVATRKEFYMPAKHMLGMQEREIHNKSELDDYIYKLLLILLSFC